MTTTRTETDSFGPLEVDASKYWGAQTQRSLGNFNINLPQEKMPDGSYSKLPRAILGARQRTTPSLMDGCFAVGTGHKG